ncbi:MAG: hypothetical protein Q8922_11030 [Bacteroidota bacterium]|nr:hypothetical protein [Bacteroidota bacterium]MDP4233645.1 hypothetical protein [Bacteroidota bacterium]MDP4243095.1 hypothetical protein [Bacteroidota bacterium]MDP4288459.1 hypothetical protein [Bacteroidota bacterium]
MKIIRYPILISAFIISGLVPRAFAQYAPYNLSVAASASIREQPPQIILSWLLDDSAMSYSIFRRVAQSGDQWNLMAGVGKALTWTDTTVETGVEYEYRIHKIWRHGSTSNLPGEGYLQTGIDVPAEESRGTLDLIVDDTFANDLSTELARLTSDIRADGWSVVRHNVKRSDSVEAIRAIIMDDYAAIPDLRTVFLFGHVPVPYSGFLNPDGHPNHYGAWPADIYYADMSGDYTDVQSDTSSLHSVAANINIPGDGKFDETAVGGGIELEIGRVDMWNLPSFSKSEKELLRQYLNKDHAFRTGAMTAPSRALISDNFGTYGEGFASSGWRNFPNLVGKENVKQLGWFTTLDTASYLWAYGCGGGSFTSCGGIGTTTDFATKESRAIFSMLFGSYFGDWNVQDNILRAPLAGAMTLTCCWAGRPQWYFHPMAMGHSTGYCTRLTQNNLGDYDPGYGAGWVHIALMGDPTLREAFNDPPSEFASIAATVVSNRAVNIRWTTQASVDGYNIYRAHHTSDPLVKLNSVPLATLEFTDSLPFLDSNIYEVRPVSKSGGVHGSYYTAGQASNPVTATGLADVAPATYTSAGLRVEYDGPLVSISLQSGSSMPGRLSLYDLTGREVLTLDGSVVGKGMHNYIIDTRAQNLSSSIYFARFVAPDEQDVAKILLSR